MKMCKEQFASKNLFEYDKYIAKDLIDSKAYPWEILSDIGKYINSISENLGKLGYFVRKGADGKYNIWVASTVKISDTSTLYGPLIIDHETEIRTGAFIRGNVIIGKNCVIGNSTEIKNSVIMDNVQLPHYNYVGDSVIGNYAHLGAGAIISNLKSTKTEVYIDRTFPTGLRKAGAFIGDNVEVGCNSVLNPGTVIGKGSIIYPVSCVRGFIEENTIVKVELNISKRSKKQ